MEQIQLTLKEKDTQKLENRYLKESLWKKLHIYLFIHIYLFKSHIMQVPSLLTLIIILYGLHTNKLVISAV